MIYLDFKDIQVVATVEMHQHNFNDAFNTQRRRMEKCTVVTVAFWDFVVPNSELIFIKSILQYFMSCYWKRGSKDGSKIQLQKELVYYDGDIPKTLQLMARQKAKEHYLYVSLLWRGLPANEVYIDAQEVMMLDIAISKAINLLMPEVMNIKC